jgi:hypothetical protein
MKSLRTLVALSLFCVFASHGIRSAGAGVQALNGCDSGSFSCTYVSGAGTDYVCCPNGSTCPPTIYEACITE